MTNTRSRPPAPTTISKQAQQFLSAPAFELSPYPALDDTDAWLQRIQKSDALMARLFGELPVQAEEAEIAGVHSYVIRANDVAHDDAAIYIDIHGGGLINCGGPLVRLSGSRTALMTGIPTWAVDYRMPPLHPFPAGLDDCVAVYRAALEQRGPANVFVGGASAGGNLAAALLLRAKDEGLPMPAALVLLTPEVDLTESGDTFQTLDGIDNVLTSLKQANLLYAGGHDLAEPYVSPLFGDVTGFPPTFLQSGTRDLFLSNTVRMHRKLRAAGVEADLNVWEAMPHGGFFGAPEDQEIAREVRSFLDRHRSRG